MFGVLINVGSSGSNPNGRGRTFKDLSFEYLPIPEEQKTTEKVPTYRELGFTYVKYPDLPVHKDPEFETFTYGHVKRGFGDIKSFLRLKDDKNGVLFFYATLQQDERWSAYIIGYFKRPEIHDCRKLSKEQISKFKDRGFSNNAHLKRVDPSVDLLIKGGQNSELLDRAFPLTENNNRLQLRKSLEDIIFTATGRKVESGKPWFRWTLTSNDCPRLLRIMHE